MKLWMYQWRQTVAQQSGRFPRNLPAHSAWRQTWSACYSITCISVPKVTLFKHVLRNWRSRRKVCCLLNMQLTRRARCAMLFHPGDGGRHGALRGSPNKPFFQYAQCLRQLSYVQCNMGMVSGLKFLRDHLGFDMSLDDELVSAPADVVPAAPLKQACPFTARDLWVFETLVHSSNHVQRYLGMAAAVLAYSGIRFKHAQRSKFVSKMNLAWKLSCSKGTSRRARRCPPPFDWAMPIAGVWQATLGDLFFQHWDRLCSRQWTFLVPALRPYRTSLADPTGFTPVPMNTSAWQHILQQFVTLSPAAWGPRTEPSDSIIP